MVDHSFIKLCFLAFIQSCLVMPYSNWKRHNPPSIPQTPYQPLIILVPNFDPIYQVILLENSNEWNLFPVKRWILKKGSKDWKAKEVKPHMKSSMLPKKEYKIYKLLGEILSKERHFPIAQNPMSGLIHTHTSFTFSLPSIPWVFPFLPPFTTPYSINHDYLPHKLFRIFLYFYNIQGVA
jgi:hypothetical protein